MLNKEKLLNLIVSSSMILIALIGCSTSKYGKLVSQKEITQSFETYQVLPGHKYYYRGASSKPTVIVGINDNYELNLPMWLPIDTESDNFRRLIDIVSLQGMGKNIRPWGFNIIGNNGDYVGVWYSAIRNAAVEINENRQIINLQPGTMVAVGDQLR